MLRSLSLLPASRAARHEARAKAKIGLVRGHLSKVQYDALQRQRRSVERDIKLQQRLQTARLAEPYRETTRQIVVDIFQEKGFYQGFRGATAVCKGENGLKRTHGMMDGVVAIRRHAADKDIDADVNPKRRRYFPVICRDTMEWVSVPFVSSLDISLTFHHLEDFYYRRRDG